jgi:hypothetical protein
MDQRILDDDTWANSCQCMVGYVCGYGPVGYMGETLDADRPKVPNVQATDTHK